MEIASNVGAIIHFLPLLLVWLGGILYAAVTWGRHPRASLLVIIALILFILTGLAGFAATALLPMLVHSRTGLPFNTIGTLLGAFQVALALVQAVAWVLVLIAALSTRTSPAAPAAPAGPR